MGMYDYIYCDYPLPKGCGVAQKKAFQTKDFDCQMLTYRITKEGRLIKEVYEYEKTPEEERPFWGTEKWDKGEFYRLCGSMRPKQDTPPIDINFHGDVNFYTSHGLEGEWFEFAARFTDGELQWVRRVTDDEGKHE